MKWKTHIAIAKAIANSLGLTQYEREALIEGSIEPDKYPDRVVRVSQRGNLYTGNAPHHNPDNGLIMRYIWYARQNHLKERDAEAMRNLGRALHYIQDKSVYKGVFGGAHDSVEEELTRHHDAVWDGAIKGVSEAKCSPAYVESRVYTVRPTANPHEIARTASAASAAVATAVLGTKTPPTAVVASYKDAKKRFWKITIPAALITSLAFLFVAYITHDYLYILPGLLGGYIIQRVDVGYRRWKKEAKWFGVS